MRFLPNGPDVPPDLVAAQETGQTLFVCGAGVSRTAGLPLFRGLVKGVYQELDEDWTLHLAENEGMRQGGALEGQYDRVLRCLERRLVGSTVSPTRGVRERIRAAVRKVLSPPDGVDLNNHLALLKLSRDSEGRIRVLTTNFDTLFERAWFEKHGQPISSHAGPALPQPKVAGCTGALHLHGRLADPQPALGLSESDLVLTSAEFGDAYLRSGWASRYVYDLVRAHTLVLVGYQADDPPMRYLLEALEADRERYPDLQKVYAFAPAQANNKELVRALWGAKGVQPIAYIADGDDHSLLYDTLREWQRYADDPTAWRRERLRAIFSHPSESIGDDRLEECIALLRHGDAGQLLGELSPRAEWLPLLSSNGVFNQGGAHPGEWLASRIDDPEMIRAAAGLVFLDERTRWQIHRAIENKKAKLSSVRTKAWRLLLTAKQQPLERDLGEAWYRVADNIKRGEAGYKARKIICEILRPRLEVRKAFRWSDDQSAEEGQESVHQLLWPDFESERHPSVDDILTVWPGTLDHNLALFRSVNRALIDALEDAQDVGFLDHSDRASDDVPSVAPHPQNAYRSGFYPIVRLLADLWGRIRAQESQLGRTLALGWAESDFHLVKRLWLFTLADELFAPHEVAAALTKLDDFTFWVSGAQVELMRLLTKRWMDFSAEDRCTLETKLARGMPRSLFPSDAFEDENDWISIRDSSIFRRLKRIEVTGRRLSSQSQDLLREISNRHPTWRPRPGDRDDFHVWHESRSGLDGHPELLSEVADEKLVAEAMRLQRERYFEEGDVWRIFCAADPDRALRGLRTEAQENRWEIDAWRPLIWAASEIDDRGFQVQVADALLQMPDMPLRELLPSATSWLQRRREVLSGSDKPRDPPFFALWDTFSDVAYGNQNADGEPPVGEDLLTESLNRPGGVLAWALLEALRAGSPEAGSCLSPQFRNRFDRIVAAKGAAGLLGRVCLAQALSYVHTIDPNWVEAALVPRLSWQHPDAQAMWSAHSQDRVGPARLFNTLKPAMLQAFDRHNLPNDVFEGLISRMLSVAISHQHGEALDYVLTTTELKRALTVGPPSVRQNVSWNLWRLMAKEEGDPADKATRWRQVFGPLLRDIWPLDGNLRSEETSHNLVLMALECEAAFPEAVESILDLVIPYKLYQLSYALRLEKAHEKLVHDHPLALVRLTNVLIDPAVHPVPNDLPAFLRDCRDADRAIVSDPAYIRLYGLRRRLNA